MVGTVFINCHIIHGIIFAVPSFQSKCESCTFLCRIPLSILLYTG